MLLFEPDTSDNVPLLVLKDCSNCYYLNSTSVATQLQTVLKDCSNCYYLNGSAIWQGLDAVLKDCSNCYYLNLNGTYKSFKPFLRIVVIVII